MPSPFDYRPMTDEQSQDSAILRDAYHDLYTEILDAVPESAERTLCLRRLEESSFWANKAITWGGANTLQEDPPGGNDERSQPPSPV
jgi:hypothetical protein